MLVMFIFGIFVQVKVHCMWSDNGLILYIFPRLCSSSPFCDCLHNITTSEVFHLKFSKGFFLELVFLLFLVCVFINQEDIWLKTLNKGQQFTYSCYCTWVYVWMCMRQREVITEIMKDHCLFLITCLVAYVVLTLSSVISLGHCVLINPFLW